MNHAYLLIVATTAFAATSLTAQVEIYGSPRGRAPDNWTRFEWPEKKAVLFGQYAPTDEELALIDKAMPTKPSVSPARARKVLLFYRCAYPHASIATGVAAFEKMAEATDAFEVEATDDPTVFTPDELAAYDAVLFNNTTDFDVTIGPEGRAALLDFVKSGKGLIGIHSGSDACKKWKEGSEMIGGVFAGHPWLSKGTWAFQLESPEHSLNRCFHGEGFWLRDEVYQYREGTHSRDRSRVLISLDMSHPENLDGPGVHEKLKDRIDPEGQYSLAWIQEVGKGRVFYSNFGHNNTTFWQQNILRHYLDGIQYALGDLPADATPSGKLESIRYAPAPKRE